MLTPSSRVNAKPRIQLGVHVKYWSIFILWSAFCSPAFANSSDKALNELLSKSPEATAESAFAKGHAQYLAVPACGELFPGYPTAGLTSEPPAFASALRPAGTCEQFLGKDKMDQLRRLRDFAEAHNRRLFELQSKKTRQAK